MKKYTVVVLSLFIISGAHAISLEEIKQKVRPFIENLLGKDKAVKVLGAEARTLTLPKIPSKIKNKNTDTTVFDFKENEKKALSEKVKMNLDLQFVREVFQETRNVSPNSEQMNNWINALTQGATREGVYRGVVLDSTYAGLENYEKPVNDSIVKFSLKILKEFLNKEVKKTKIQTFNFYTLKRVVVERALDVSDVLKYNNDDFTSWYGLMSAELALKYNDAFKSEVRSNPDEFFHKAWAEQMPIQMVKSEIIIKLHKIFNFLD